MRINIEIESVDLAMLFDLLHLKDVPRILEEPLEDIQENRETPCPEPEPVKRPKAAARKRSKSPMAQNRPVDVRTDKGWKTFPSVKSAAQSIGCAPCRLSDALSKGGLCYGHEVRRHKEEPDHEEPQELPRGDGNE